MTTLPLRTAMKFLLILNWGLWSALLVALIYWLVLILVQDKRSPEAGPALGYFLVGVGLVFLAVTGGLLYWLAQKKSVVALIVLSWPLVPFIARPIVRAAKHWKYDHAKSSISDISGS